MHLFPKEVLNFNNLPAQNIYLLYFSWIYKLLYFKCYVSFRNIILVMTIVLIHNLTNELFIISS